MFEKQRKNDKRKKMFSWILDQINLFFLFLIVSWSTFFVYGRCYQFILNFFLFYFIYLVIFLIVDSLQKSFDFYFDERRREGNSSGKAGVMAVI